MALGWLWCFWFLVDIIPYFQFVVVPYGKWFYYATTVVRHMSHDVRMSIMYQTKSTKDDMWRRRYLVFFGISWNMEPTSKIIISTVRKNIIEIMENVRRCPILLALIQLAVLSVPSIVSCSQLPYGTAKPLIFTNNASFRRSRRAPITKTIRQKNTHIFQILCSNI